MSKLLSAMNRTARTDNGAVQYESTRSPCLDFFQQAGALRVATAGGEEAIARLWSLAYAQDRDTAIRILQWAYDCRGGAGSRDVMRVVLPRLVNSMDGFGNQKQLQQLLIAIPELGRWDMVSDLLEYDDLPAWLRSFVFRLIKAGLDDEKTAPLVAKWLPRKGKVANRLRGWFKLTRQDYRHMLSKYETVETLKSAGLWEHIKYQNVPSVCMARSRSSFMKHDKERFEAFLQQVAAKHVGRDLPDLLDRERIGSRSAASERDGLRVVHGTEEASDDGGRAGHIFHSVCKCRHDGLLSFSLQSKTSITQISGSRNADAAPCARLQPSRFCDTF